MQKARDKLGLLVWRRGWDGRCRDLRNVLGQSASELGIDAVRVTPPNLRFSPNSTIEKARDELGLFLMAEQTGQELFTVSNYSIFKEKTGQMGHSRAHSACVAFLVRPYCVN